MSIASLSRSLPWIYKTFEHIGICTVDSYAQLGRQLIYVYNSIIKTHLMKVLE